MADSPTFAVTDGDAGLRIVNLRKSYRKRLVIRDVSMELGRGEVVALLGPNGSGKTTCFYSIAGSVISAITASDRSKAELSDPALEGAVEFGRS